MMSTPWGREGVSNISGQGEGGHIALFGQPFQFGQLERKDGI